MSILDLDVTARRDPGSIRGREFATVRKGYDPDQVRSFLDQVATWVDDLEIDLATTRAEARRLPAAPPPQAAPEPVVDPYAVLGARVAEVLRVAEEHAARITEEAEASIQRMLEEARDESQRMRTRAQEEADGVRQSAQEYSDATRRAAQEEADRVREDAADALESARVEAERTVAGLSERQSALAAELHATRSRLLGIVSQLEDESDEEPIEIPEEPLRAHPVPITSFIPPDDPRRDPVPPEIPSFVPPPAPPRVSIPQLEVDGIEQAEVSAAAYGTVADALDGAADGIASDAAADGSVGAADGIAADAPDGAADDGTPPEIAAATGIDDGTTPAEISADEPSGIAGDSPEVATPAAAEETDPATAAGADPGDAESVDETPAKQRSFLQWTNEEAQDGPGFDLSLPDFPSIDIPTLEDEERRKD